MGYVVMLHTRVTLATSGFLGTILLNLDSDERFLRGRLSITEKLARYPLLLVRSKCYTSAH